ncbi:MAG: potassium-transporting ATPase subunit KdpC [Ignavibacteriae bacterium]|nr:potassium-transporting ATPase subunit KdpC [Ignavibacteriota bacterium]
MRHHLRPALVLLAGCMLLTGAAYPALVTALADLFFPWQRHGSLIRHGDTVLGSALLGQQFSRPEYFWGRLSATVPMPYNAGASGGSNYAPTHDSLLARARQRIADLRAFDTSDTRPVPVDLVTASGSGLDPHISVAAAMYQIPRVAKARGIPEEPLYALIESHTESRGWGFLGEARVHVLRLNIALDSLREGPTHE